MEIIQTEMQKQYSDQPTKLEVLRELEKRGGLKNSDEYQKQLYISEKGYRGEERFIKYLEAFGNSNWKVLRNVWLEHYGEFEIDFLVATDIGLLPVETKNLTGKLELTDGQCFRNGRIYTNNPFTQAQKVSGNIEQIFSGHPNISTINGLLSFVGTFNRVQVNDPLSGIDVIVLNELQHYIWNLVQQERNSLGYPYSIYSVLHTLAPYEIGKSSKEKKIPDALKLNLRKGICCRDCGKFNLVHRNSYVICPCGMHESKEEAIVRTICEYGVIFADLPLTTASIAEFFNGEVSESTVLRNLRKHFTRQGNSKNTNYKNPKRPLLNIQAQYTFAQPKYQRID